MATRGTLYRLLAILILAIVACPAAIGADALVGSSYFADTPFPQFMYLWQEGWSLKDAKGDIYVHAKPDMPLGGYAFICFRNTSDKPMKVTDLTLEGIKMSEAIAPEMIPERVENRFNANITLSKLPKEQIEVVRSAGAPAWWRVEPREIAAGGVGQITIRMRRAPKLDTIKFGVVSEQPTIEGKIAVNLAQPRFATIAFSPDLNTVYLYARHPKQGVKPSKILINDMDVTASSTISSDKSLDLAPIVVKLAEPLKWMALYHFRAVYPDGSTAIAAQRAWGHEMVYGMWYAPSDVGQTEEDCKRIVENWMSHNLNAAMGGYTGSGDSFFFSDKGWEYRDKLGFGLMTNYASGDHPPLFLFAMDEPDATDAHDDVIPVDQRVGSQGQYLAKWSNVLNRVEPRTPVLLNIDNTFKPENWYMYHQLTDIPCVDPYYPEQLDQSYHSHPGNYAAHTKPTYIYAVSTISQSSGQPKPLHVILCSTRYDAPGGYHGRFPTPEEKRLETYYAVSAGAKGISFWWFPPDDGCGSKDPAGVALYNEIGLLGAEIRTAGPVISTSCPITLPIKASGRLMIRTLLSGSDTVAVITLNDDVLCDRVGTVYKPVGTRAVATVDMPSWIEPKDVFEITSDGVKDLSFKRDGSKVTLQLGTVEISRFAIVTADPGLRARLAKIYETGFAANVAKLKAPR